MTPIVRAEQNIKQRGGIWTNEGWVVEGILDLWGFSLSALPKIKSVGGDFLCDNNPLASLSGLPNKIGGNFICDNNLSFPKEEIMLLIKARPKNLKKVVKAIIWK